MNPKNIKELLQMVDLKNTRGDSKKSKLVEFFESVLFADTSLTEKCSDREAKPTGVKIEAKDLGVAIHNETSKTLTYYDKDGNPLLVVENFVHGCIRVHNIKS